ANGWRACRRRAPTWTSTSERTRKALRCRPESCARERSARARLRLRRRHGAGCDRRGGRAFPRLPRYRRAWRHGLAGCQSGTPRRSAIAVAGRSFGDHAWRQLRARRKSTRHPGKPHARRDLGLRPGRRLSRFDQEAAESAGTMAGRYIRLRGQGIRRYRGGDGKTPGAGGGTGLAGQAYQSRIARVRLVAVSRRDFDDAAFRERFTKSPVKRIGRDRFVRNVLIAIGNSGDGTLAREAKRLLTDGSPLVRGAAVWALSQLLARKEFSALAADALDTEAD